MRVRVLVPSVAAVLALTVAGCGSDDDTASTGASSASTAATPSASTSAAAPAGDTKQVSGTGFRTTVPKDWRNLSKAAEGTAVRIDLLYGATGGGFANNVVVTRENPDVVAGKTAGDLADQVREQAARTVGAETPKADEPTTLDGEEAARWTLRRKAGDQSLAQRQLIAVHDDALYTVTLSAPADDDEAQGQLDTIVAGWHWD
jgi:hypothetical protein